MRRLKIIGYGRSKGNELYQFKKHSRYRVSKTQSHLSLAVEAVQGALNKADLSINDVDVIVYASAVGFQPIPCSAAILSEGLSTDKPIPCIDINTSCTSFVTALDIMSYMIEGGRYHRVLIVSSDIASIGLNEDQKESYELFSDGGAAFIFEKSDDDQGVIGALQRTWVAGVHDTEIRGGLSSLPASDYTLDNANDYLFDMQGIQVLSLVAKVLPEFIEELNQVGGHCLKDMDMIIPHQASRALSMMMKRIGIPKGQYIDIVKDYGNMVAASIPYVLCHALDEQLVNSGDKVLLLGSAAGLTISGLIIKL